MNSWNRKVESFKEIEKGVEVKPEERLNNQTDLIRTI